MRLLYGNTSVCTSGSLAGKPLGQRLRSILLVAGLGLLAGIGWGPVAAEQPGRVEPELVLLIAVDQLRRDRLQVNSSSALVDGMGGLGRLLEAGRVYQHAQLGHALSTTCPGHVTMLSGRFPGPIGVPDNAHLDRNLWQQRYCVADPDSPTLGSSDAASVVGRSPVLIEATTIGDWLQQVNPDAKVLSLGGKDRAVIALGGQRPTSAIWFDRNQGRFNTSRYYADALPPWVAPTNLPALLDALPQHWTHAAGQLRADDFEGESEQFSRISGHPLGVGEPEEVSQQFYASPWIDAAVLELAQRAIEAERLLTNQQTDLLALSLPATDVVGHHYGPYSAESADTMQRLDQGLQRLLSYIEERSEDGNLLVVLTSDHGVAALPEYLQSQGTQRCPVGQGRLPAWRVLGGMMWHVYRKFTAPFGLPQRLLTVGGTMLYVNDDPEVLGGHSHAEVVAEVERYLEAQDYVVQAWTPTELQARAGVDPLAQRYLNSYSEKHSGDLMLQLEPGCQLSSQGTTHGSPYTYDVDIPLVFYGAGVTPGVVPDAAASVDIAPTLAAMLGLSVPPNLDGKVLTVSEPDSTEEH